MSLNKICSLHYTILANMAAVGGQLSRSTGQKEEVEARSMFLQMFVQMFIQMFLQIFVKMFAQMVLQTEIQKEIRMKIFSWMNIALLP